MVPLYTLVQARAEPGERSRVIGANNIVNSVLILLLQGWLIGFAGVYGVGVTTLSWSWIPLTSSPRRSIREECAHAQIRLCCSSCC